MTITFAAAALIALAAVAITGWAAGRAVLVRLFERRLRRQASELSSQLITLRGDAYQGLDQMLYEMRHRYHGRVIETELRRELDAAGPGSATLAVSFRMLGLTDRYLSDVRTARAWRDRARAAAALGLLGEPRAVAPLVEGMRDPHEDADVKLVCAEALGRLRDPAVIAEMCELLADVDEWASPRLAQVLVEFGAGAVGPLLSTLDKSASLDARVWAMRVLGHIRDHRATGPIIERLHDRVEALRLSACSALAALGDPHAVQPLINTVLRDPVAAVRAQAARALGALGDERALPLLIASLGDADYWVRFRSLEAIEALDPADTSAIESALADPNPEVRRRAVLALDRMGKLEKPFTDLALDDERASAEAEQRLVAVGRAGLSERLVRYLGAADPRMRARIARVLGQVGEPRHTAALVPVLDDADPAVVLEVIAALGALATPAAVGPLIDQLAAPRRAARQAASAALRRFDTAALAGHLPWLAALTRDPSDEARVAALEVIAVVHDRAATGVLVDGLDDRYVDARLAAARALGRRAAHLDRAGLDAVADALADTLTDSSEPVRVAAAESLGALGTARAVEHLLAAVPAATPALCDAICHHLATLGFDRVAPALDLLMASPGDNALLSVAWTLGKTGDVRAVPLLAALLEEPDPRVRASAAGALAKLVPVSPDAGAALLRAIEDPSPVVRSAVIDGLGDASAGAVDDALGRALTDPDRFVRHRGAFAFARRLGAAGAPRLAAMGADQLDPGVATVALALTGAPLAIGEVMRRLRDPELAAAVDAALAAEGDTVRQAYRERVQPRTTKRIPVLGRSQAFEVVLDADQNIADQATALRIAVDPVERRTAAIALGQLDDDAAQTALADAVKHDPDVGVRREAITALAGARAHPPARVRDAVLAATRDPDAEVRATALRAAAALVTPATASSVLDSLGACDPRVRDAAEDACAWVFAADLTPFLAWIGGETREPVVISAIRVLGLVADDASLPLLAELRTSPVAAIRAEAMAALANLATPAAQEAVMTSLRDPVEEVRLAAVRALGGSRRAVVLEALAPVARDPSVEGRAMLATTLGAMDSTRAVEILTELTVDASARVASRAALALLTSPDDRGLAAFIHHHGAMSPDARELVRREAATVLTGVVARLTGAMTVTVRQRALRALSAIDGVTYADQIALGTRDPDPRMRLVAIEALVAAAPERLADHLRPVLDDPVHDVRAAARRALMRSV